MRDLEPLCPPVCIFALCRTLAIELGISIYVDRVASKDNIADDPSRERYELLRALGAKWLRPKMHERFMSAQDWDSLSLCCTLRTARQCEQPVVDLIEPTDLAV